MVAHEASLLSSLNVSYLAREARLDCIPKRRIVLESVESGGK
jgi:hypothetical protein